MIFGKIQNDKCVNIMLFENEQKAHDFDSTLVEVEEGYGIGDDYNGTWQHHIPTDEERIKQILEKLEELDKTVDRQWEDYYIRENVTPVERIAIVIEIKQELREELKELTGGGEYGTR